MEQFNNQQRNYLDRRVILGIVIMLFGGILLASNFNLIPFDVRHYIWSWKMVLIVIGVISLANRQRVITGIILISIGVFFMLPDIFVIPYSYHRLFWPVILIIVGIAFVLRRGGRNHYSKFHNVEEYSTDYIDDINIFGGGEKMVTSQNFKGGKITSVFGGSNIDFTNAKLAKGNIVIDVFAIFGGAKLIVPPEWEIKSEVFPIFGGFSDKRKNIKNIQSDSKLIIKGMAIFGGGEIKSY